MKKILVPTDFSDCADVAMKYAIEFAKKVNGEIFLIHVIEAPAGSFSFSTYGEAGAGGGQTTEDVQYMIALMKKTRQSMKSLKEKCEKQGVKITDNIEVGSVDSHVQEAVDKYDADMVVMGTHGSSGFDEMFVGSNAEKVVRHSNIPVLTIREEQKNIIPKRIVFASDFLEEADKVFPRVKAFADLFGSEILLLYVNTPQSFETSRASLNAIEDFQERHNATELPVHIYNEFEKEDGIINFTTDMEADMIAIGTHGRKGLSRFFNTSISKDIVNHSFCPVLTTKFEG